MNGAESLIQTAVNAGVDVCFANPGTTEMPLVTALDSVGGIRAVLGLFEGVCTGAADGYARMTGKPALTLLHLGPGFANGIANLHNARRARSPVVNLIGDHATWHASADSPLTSDILSLAKPVSAWIRKTQSPRELGERVAEAISAAARRPGNVATLIIPADCQWGEAEGPALVIPPEPPPRVKERAVMEASKALRTGEPAALLLGGTALHAAGLRQAARIAQHSGCSLLCDTFPPRVDRAPNFPTVEKIPYFPEQALELLSRYSYLILAGTQEPVAFFGYPGLPSRLVPNSTTPIVLARPEEDVVAALEDLVLSLGQGSGQLERATPDKPVRPAGAITPQNFGPAIACVQPEDAIIFDESATSGFQYFHTAAGAPPHTYLCLTGGAIGQGLPCATGAAIACPDRKVLALQADGSGMYTLQALWTQAREGLHVKTIICANRSYRVLRIELARSGIKEPGQQTCALTDLAQPVIDWVLLAKGLGVPAVRVERAEDLSLQLKCALEEPGPYLIEALF